MCLKRLFCRHEYTLLTSYKTDVDETIGYKLEELFIIYCPKCKKEKTVGKVEYEKLMAKSEVDKEHERFKYGDRR